MRLGILDIGSNTVHLLVVDAYTGGPPLPAHSSKHELRLAEYLTDDGEISTEGAKKLTHIVSQAQEEAEALGADELLAFATSALREAPNGEQVIADILRDTGAELEVLTGPAEAKLTFLATRRWFGWSAGRILNLDIGGGSLEIAIGQEEEPDYADSLPFGAGRLTRTFLTEQEPVAAEQLKTLNKHLITGLAKVRRELNRFAEPDRVVGSSKTFRMLARATDGPYLSNASGSPRRLLRDSLDDLVTTLKTMTVKDRVNLSGVSESRAPQLLAGALVAQSAMHTFDIEEMVICPWALREGIILRRLDLLSDPETDDLMEQHNLPGVLRSGGGPTTITNSLKMPIEELSGEPVGRLGL